jgi:hypothetical protein
VHESSSKSKRGRGGGGGGDDDDGGDGGAAASASRSMLAALAAREAPRGASEVGVRLCSRAWSGRETEHSKRAKPAD